MTFEVGDRVTPAEHQKRSVHCPRCDAPVDPYYLEELGSCAEELCPRCGATWEAKEEE